MTTFILENLKTNAKDTLVFHRLRWRVVSLQHRRFNIIIIIPCGSFQNSPSLGFPRQGEVPGYQENCTKMGGHMLLHV